MDKGIVAQELIKISKLLTGGLFEAPPAMVNAIYKWTVAQWSAARYASNREVLKNNKMLYGSNQERLEYLKTLLDRYDEAHGEVEGPTKKEMEKLIEEREKNGEEILERLKKIQSENKGLLEDVRSVPSVKLRKWTKVKRSFVPDFSGWKHKKILDGAEPKRVESVKMIYGKIDVVLTGGNIRGVRGTAASWNSTKYRVTIKVNMYSSLRGLRSNIRHELQHFAQDFLRLVMAGEGKSTPGLPSRKIKTPEITQQLSPRYKIDRAVIRKLKQQGILPSSFHSLDDIEFYTELSDEIDSCKELIEDNPDRSKKEIIREFTGISKHDALSSIKTSTFFRNLKHGSLSKWKKAVTELTKAIL